MNAESLKPVLLLAIINKALIDMLTAPIRTRFPQFDLWFMVYVAFVTGTLLGWFAGVNALGDQIALVWLARLITAMCVGAGSSLIYEVIKEIKEIGANLGVMK